MTRNWILAAICLGVLACVPWRSHDKVEPFIPKPEVQPSSVDQLFKRGEIDLALSLLERNLKDAETGQDLYWYGVALRMRGRLKEAVGVFQKAADREQKLRHSAQRQLVSLNIELGEYREAGALLSKLASSEQDQALARFLEGFSGTPHVVSSREALTLNFESSSLPEVKLRLEGRENAKFVVDTGASFSVINVSLANRLGIFQRIEGGILLDLEGKPIQASYGVIGWIDLGPIQVRNIPVVIVEDSALRFRLFGLHSVFEAEGVLGMSLLRNFRMVFDFPAKRLFLLDPAAGERKSIPLTGTGLNLFVSGTLEGSGSLMFRIDTGSNQSSITPLALKSANLENRTVPSINFVAGAEGWSASLREIAGAQMQVGDYRFKNLRLPVMSYGDDTPLSVGGVIGVDLLQHFQVTLDPYLMSCSLEQ